jgi:hypothetical protein
MIVDCSAFDHSDLISITRYYSINGAITYKGHDLPTLNWEWYKREDSVGQVRRRIIEHCRPPLSRTKVATAFLK